MVKKITYNAREILYIDYSDCQNEEEMVANLLEAQAIIIKENKAYRQLTNLAGSYPTFNFMKKAKEIARDTPKLAIKRAVLGIDSPSRKVLLKGYNLIIGGTGLAPFDSEKEALEWLTKEK
ncbi:MAG: hypothetical protein ACNS62_07480 [Candidatus Cyclobacteriaceae bacterium M3_2C_046]